MVFTQVVNEWTPEPELDRVTLNQPFMLEHLFVQRARSV